MKEGKIKSHGNGVGVITPTEKEHDVFFSDEVVQGDPASLQKDDPVKYETDAINENAATKVVRA